MFNLFKNPYDNKLKKVKLFDLVYKRRTPHYRRCWRRLYYAKYYSTQWGSCFSQSYGHIQSRKRANVFDIPFIYRQRSHWFWLKIYSRVRLRRLKKKLLNNKQYTKDNKKSPAKKLVRL